ncbi:hypothetical protein [Actinoallomurus iriomotensis]|uniref:hypothetical protein n=1 Tax=Actinoallomurus iriomotensis TaxID=478107 RepID=UPI0025565EB9|nr:hypothetical protein [Actinoallomurus iriomotensis]
MSEPTPPDIRWLVERIDRNHAETAGDIAELKVQVAAIPAAMDRYVLAEVYRADERRRDAERDADRAQIKALQATDSSQAASGKAWVLGIALMVGGAVLGYIGQIMQAKGH